MSPWGWSPERTQGIWRYGAPSLRPLVVAAPWVTVVLLLLLFWFIGGTLVSSKGLLFDLPDTNLAEGEATGPVALILPIPNETLVFFDDSRYLMSDPNSMASLGEHLAETATRTGRRTLLALADRRVPGGELMAFAALARRNGVRKVLFAEKKAGDDE